MCLKRKSRRARAWFWSHESKTTPYVEWERQYAARLTGKRRICVRRSNRDPLLLRDVRCTEFPSKLLMPLAEWKDGVRGTLLPNRKSPRAASLHGLRVRQSCPRGDSRRIKIILENGEYVLAGVSDNQALISSLHWEKSSIETSR